MHAISDDVPDRQETRRSREAGTSFVRLIEGELELTCFRVRVSGISKGSGLLYIHLSSLMHIAQASGMQRFTREAPFLRQARACRPAGYVSDNLRNKTRISPRRGSERVCLPVRHRSGVMGPWDLYGPCSGGPRSASRYHVVGPGELTPASPLPPVPTQPHRLRPDLPPNDLRLKLSRAHC